ncbi:hypothetical protein BT96DRAFT_932302 [Gymnopus androsaceus JB14]|uniref:Mitochondrial carrier n=1 Tax=Gymnopus androsaceus JB14 TaxID=1447944 RepID=A0A6A4IA57_9AGAR|nr:hypothetical protein BT96DRAFT_932302 [Gymnopus androsaceus JB14]
MATLNPILFRHYARASIGKAVGIRSLTGSGQVFLLPLGVLKFKRQVNPEALRGRGIIRTIAEENTALYRGWGWPMARNARIFGASAFSKVPVRWFIWELIKNEGMTTFFKDSKIIVVGPKLVCSYILAQFFIPLLKSIRPLCDTRIVDK